MKKLTWNEISNFKSQELKGRYKLSDRQLEQGMRHHLDGANTKERHEVYNKLWRKE